MQNIKILIVEDDPLIARDIELLLRDWGYQTTANLPTGEAALENFLENPPDLALVDIQLQGNMDGIELAQKLQTHRPTPVVFLTAQADFSTVQRAKIARPSAYLLKPFDERHLHISLEIALNAPPTAADFSEKPRFAHEVKIGADTLLRKDDFIFIKQNYRFVKFRAADIRYLEADKNHSILCTADHKYALRMPLTTVLERLQQPELVRVSRTFAVNVKFVDEFDDSEVVVAGRSFSMTAAFREEFLRSFNVI